MLSRRAFLKSATLAGTVGAVSLAAPLASTSQASTVMTGMQTIMTRRSIREYTDEAISDKHIESLLKAAMQAPSAGNEQPWEFLVVTDKAKLEAITTMKKGVKMAKGAPLAILTCYNTELVSEAQKAFAVQSIACATQNILLAAHALGLGAVWTSAYPNEKFVKIYRELFNLPAHIVPVAFVVIGHPKNPVEPKNDYKPERVHTNVW